MWVEHMPLFSLLEANVCTARRRQAEVMQDEDASPTGDNPGKIAAKLISDKCCSSGTCSLYDVRLVTLVPGRHG